MSVVFKTWPSRGTCYRSFSLLSDGCSTRADMYFKSYWKPCNLQLQEIHVSLPTLRKVTENSCREASFLRKQNVWMVLNWISRGVGGTNHKTWCGSGTDTTSLSHCTIRISVINKHTSSTDKLLLTKQQRSFIQFVLVIKRKHTTLTVITILTILTLLTMLALITITYSKHYVQ